MKLFLVGLAIVFSVTNLYAANDQCLAADGQTLLEIRRATKNGNLISPLKKEFEEYCFYTDQVIEMLRMYDDSSQDFAVLALLEYTHEAGDQITSKAFLAGKRPENEIHRILDIEDGDNKENLLRVLVFSHIKERGAILLGGARNARLEGDNQCLAADGQTLLEIRRATKNGNLISPLKKEFEEYCFYTDQVIEMLRMYDDSSQDFAVLALLEYTHEAGDQITSKAFLAGKRPENEIHRILDIEDGDNKENLLRVLVFSHIKERGAILLGGARNAHRTR